MPEGGSLTFRTGRAVEKSDASADGVVIAGSHVVIAISACGYGISADDPERAFIDLGAVEECSWPFSGHIEICREAGQGTTVRIYLPQATGLAELPAENPGHACISKAAMKPS
jgi:hypothetical protein